MCFLNSGANIGFNSLLTLTSVIVFNYERIGEFNVPFELSHY
jgi:hypothetical protein